ncbi:MAG: UDP-3-O-(3-hydroxymyristoyl)glucosamine N-acyltransferase [Desulfonatronovibrionaceae bacterium]
MLLSELVARLGLSFTGDDLEITGVNTLEDARPDQISFLADAKYLPQLEITRAGAVILKAEQAARVSRAVISSAPYLDLARTMKFFESPQGLDKSCPEQANIQPGADIHPQAIVHPMAFVGAGACIGAGTRIFPHVYIGENCRVGQDCVIYPQVSIMAGCLIGSRVVIHPGAVIGSDGFGFAEHGQCREKIPQLGMVVIEDDVEIGSCTTIDRATLGQTVVGSGTKIDNLVQIAHNVRIGKNCVIVSQVGISGSSRLGDNVILGGQVGVAGHLEIGSKARVAAKSGISRSLEGGRDYGGIPAVSHAAFLKNAVLYPRLPELFKKVKKLEKQISSMEQESTKGENR